MGVIVPHSSGPPSDAMVGPSASPRKSKAKYRPTNVQLSQFWPNFGSKGECYDAADERESARSRDGSSASASDSHSPRRVSAAGTATRTLREKVTELTRENARLERINQAQERESAELKKRVAELEESLLSLNQPRCSISSPCPKCGAHTETLKTQLDDLKADNNSLKASLKEHKQAMTHFAACYAFTLLAKCTPDGLVDFEGLSKYSTFAAYSRKVLKHLFDNWQFLSRVPGRMCQEDFVSFVTMIEERAEPESQRFLFRCLDIDGDGYLSRCDAKWFFDALDKPPSCIDFDSLWQQIVDMVGECHPEFGFTLRQLKESQLGSGVVGLLLNHNDMLFQRTTAEFSDRDIPF